LPQPGRLIDALRRVRDAGGCIEMVSLGRDLRLSRTELDRLLAYADDERRGLLRVQLDIKTGANLVALTAAGARKLPPTNTSPVRASRRDRSGRRHAR
jgi:hypothetical protein